MSEVVVITGATSGVGRAIVRRFAKDKASIALIARDREGLDAARKEVEAAGGRAMVLPIDVSDHAAMEAAAKSVEEAFGPIDIWINDAMATVFSWFWEIEPEEFQRSTDVTYHGYVWGTRAALQHMMPRDRGTIVQVGSAMAYRGIPLQSPYCGAKAAIKNFQESLRTELRAKGSKVHLTMVQLPGVNTPQFEHARAKMPKVPMPVPPVYQPEVAADAVHYAAHHKRREIYVGLPTVYTIVGNKIAPGLVERYLAKTGIKSQQTDQDLGQDVRPGNLESAPSTDQGAHGPFDDMAHEHSIQLMLTKHRAKIGALAGAAGVAAAVRRGASRDGHRAGRFTKVKDMLPVGGR
ncbi:MAG TPA: SDR family oxidoreductase [Baekduia sp.]|nr:SDR family oxidoreductase [Baekduia sp.]